MMRSFAMLTLIIGQLLVRFYMLHVCCLSASGSGFQLPTFRTGLHNVEKCQKVLHSESTSVPFTAMHINADPYVNILHYFTIQLQKKSTIQNIPKTVFF